jgi:thioredoxin 1
MQIAGIIALIVAIITGGYFATRSATPDIPSPTKVLDDAGKTMEATKEMAEKSADAMAEKTMDTMEKTTDAMMEGKTVTTPSADAMKKDATMKKDEAVMAKHGSYEAYSSAKLTMAETGKVVLFFRASWCPTCKGLDADIKKNALTIPAGVTILDVDYDNSSELKKKYVVTYQHTLVQVDAKGNQISKWQGSPSLAALVGKIQ